MGWCGSLEKYQYEQLMRPSERLLTAFSEMAAWGYAYSDADVRFPAYRPCLPSSKCLSDNPTSCVSSHKTNCSSMTSYLLFTVYPDQWTSQDYKDLQIMDAARPWSPIECVASKSFGEEVVQPVPLEWHLSQKWKSLDPLSGGHARLVRCLDDGNTLFVLEATNRNNLGVTTSVITWDELVEGNAGCRLALLK